MLNIVTSFLLALLTDRVLIIYSPDYDFREIFCTPFPNSTWVLPRQPKIPGSKLINRHSVNNALTNFYEISQQIIYLQNVEQYILTDFFANEHFKPRLNQLFPSRNVGTVLLKYLIHPTNDLWAEILNTFEERSKDALTVGLQIRHPVTNAAQSLKYDNKQVRTALHDIILLSMCDKVVLSVRSSFGYLIMAFKGSLCPTAQPHFSTRKIPFLKKRRSHEVKNSHFL
jgi:hypothetical protein